MNVIASYVMMEEKHNYWTLKNSTGSLQTCSFREAEFCKNINNAKYIFLDPPLQFQDKPSEVIVENFAANFISKLFYEAFKITCKITLSIPCSLDCHSFNLPLWNDSIQWHDLKLYLTPELLRDKKSAFILDSKALTKLNINKIKNSRYTNSGVSHIFFTSKTISDIYNVPFDSDIYAIPLDVKKNLSLSQNQIQSKLLNSNARYCQSSSPVFGQCLLSETSSPASTNSNYIMKPFASESISCSIEPNRFSKNTCIAPEAVHITMAEVRQYLKTLYCTSYSPGESKNFTNPAKHLKNPFKSVYNNLSNVNKPNTLNTKKTYTFAYKKKKKKNNSSSNFATDFQKLSPKDKLKNHPTYHHNFPEHFKQILCSIFRIKKLPFSHQSFCKNSNHACSENAVARFNSDRSQNHANPKIKPPFSKRALPPLPRFSDEHTNNPDKECGSLNGFKETFASLPLSPPTPSSSLTFKSRLSGNAVDFAASIEKVKNYGWYWGPISGEAAEKILTDEPDGSFIVRDSSDDYYIFSLTFKLNSIIRHVRIEHDQGNFSFGNSTRFKSHTIVDFIESAVEHSRSGRYLFFLHRRPVLGPMRVQLLHPVSRFKQVQSLQHLSRFVILKIVRKDLISSLPLPKRLLNYLSTQHYYSETLTDEERIEVPDTYTADPFVQLDEEEFS